MDLLAYFTDLYINLNRGLNYVITCLLYNICIVYLFNDSKYNSWKNVLFKLLDVLILSVAQIALGSLFYPLAKKYMQFIIYPLLAFGHAFIMNHYKWFDRVLKASTLSVSFLLILEMTSDLGMIFTLWNETLIFVFLLFGVTIYFLKRFEFNDLKVINYSAFFTNIITACLMLVSMIVRSLLPTNDDTTFLCVQLTIFTSFFIILLLMYYVCFKTSEEYQKRIEEELINARNKNNVDFFKFSNQTLEDMKHMRHDLKNHYAFMRSLLENKEYDKLSTYFNGLFESNFVPLNYIDTGNQTVTSILNIKMQKAKENSIHLDTKILIPSSLKISDTDLIALLSNVLDNAIEGTSRDKIEDATIFFQMIYEEPYVSIKVINPVSNAVNPNDRLNIATLKDDKELHGLGKKIINGIVKKYDGSISYSIEDGKFVFSALLKNNLEQEESN